MNQFDLISEEYQAINKQLISLNEEYKDQIKGEVYQRRYTQLFDKLNSLKNKAHRLGAEGTIIEIKGKRVRRHKKNPNISVEVSFTLYFNNITEYDAIQVLHYRFKNIKTYTLKVIKPGEIQEQ